MKKAILLLTATFLLPLTAHAFGFSLGASGSTIGYGPEAEMKIDKYISLRANLYIGTIKLPVSYDSVKYTLKQKADTQILALDYHPFGGSFFISGGMARFQNKITAKAKAATTYTISGTQFTSAQTGRIDGVIAYPNKIAPYMGFGLKSGNEDGLNFKTTIGAIYMKKPSVLIHAQNKANPALNTAVAKLNQKINANANKLRFVPVVALDMSYKF